MVSFRYFFLILCTSFALAQGSVSAELKGKVNSGAFNVDGVYVINLNTEKAAITDVEGYFSILAVVGDTLLFSTVQYKSIRIVLASKDFEKRLLFVKMQPIMNQLDEVVIRRYDKINAVSLGIIPASQKSYTVAERRLKSGSSLISLISGSKASLKKQVEVEKKETSLKQLDAMFEEWYFIKYLKIPTEYVNGFRYYIVENKQVAIALKSKNKPAVTSMIGKLSLRYNEIIASENE